MKKRAYIRPRQILVELSEEQALLTESDDFSPISGGTGGSLVGNDGSGKPSGSSISGDETTSSFDVKAGSIWDEW